MEHDRMGHASHAGFWKSGYAVAMIVIGSMGLYFLMTPPPSIDNRHLTSVHFWRIK